MVLSTSRKAVIDYIRSVTGLSAAKVIWANSNMPRPAKPYVTAKMTAFKTRGLPSMNSPDINGAGLLVQHKDFTLALQYFGDSTYDPVEKLLDVEGGLSHVVKYKILTDAGVVYVDTLMGPSDISAMVDTAFERTGALDLWMRMPWVTSDADQGVIEDVWAEGIMMSPEGISINVFGISVDA
jgi:hypothetical protein